MKKYTKFILLTLLLITTFSAVEVKAGSTINKVVYFYSDTCESCIGLKGEDISGGYTEANDYIKKIEDSGIEIIYLDIHQQGAATVIPDNILYDGDTPTVGDLMNAFSLFYDVPLDKQTTGLIFAGENYYHGNEIVVAFDNGELQLSAQNELMEVNVTVGQNYEATKGFLGFLGVLGAGLLDGFNPCAIALLLLFISLLGFTENKKMLILVSTTYITTLFVSYFLIGIGLINFLRNNVHEVALISNIVSWFIFIIVSVLFVVNFYDYIVSKNEDYGKIKNQLPKWVQKMNKRIMKTFTNAMNEEGVKGNTISVILLTFALGVTMSFTEFICTGQIYLGVLDGISYFNEFYAYFALFFYNVMFVLPMIVIAVISIRKGNIISTSNWIREHMHIIKLLNSLLFLGIAIYYAFRIFG